MASPSDKNKAPDQEADELAAWLVRYGPALQRYFMRKIGPSQAEDLVQEVFLRLQARADRAPQENVERFLFAIAKRVLIDRYRFDVAHRASLHDPIEAADSEPDEISPERILAAKQEIARALVAILDLPPRMRMAFVLHRFGKLSYSAIAQKMKITRGGVQSLMDRAVERIMEDLEDDR